MGFIDLHSHVAPGLDDGARHVADGLAMVEALTGLGFTVVFATPHQKAGAWLSDHQAGVAALAELASAVSAAQLGVELRLGAENFWDGVFHDRMHRSTLPAYEGSRAILIETHPVALPPRFGEQLFELRVRGQLPVLAHPERYAELQLRPEKAAELGKLAALCVDLGSLDGRDGSRAQATARHLLREGHAHALASDFHHPADARAIAAGFDWVRKKLGHREVERLLDENPTRILAGELPER